MSDNVSERERERYKPYPLHGSFPCLIHTPGETGIESLGLLHSIGLCDVSWKINEQKIYHAYTYMCRSILYIYKSGISRLHSFSFQKILACKLKHFDHGNFVQKDAPVA